MLDQLTITGFRSIAELSLELGRINLFIGPNASGKSNLIDSFRLLSEAARGSLYDAVNSRSGFQSLAWAGAPLGPPHQTGRASIARPRTISWQLRFRNEGFFTEEEGPVAYHLSLTELRSTFQVAESLRLLSAIAPQSGEVLNREQSGAFVMRDPKGLETQGGMPNAHELAFMTYSDPDRFKTLFNLRLELDNLRSYRHFDTSINAPIRQAQTLTTDATLMEGGQNLSVVLYNLRESSSDYFRDLIDTLRVTSPQFKALNFPTPGPAGKIILAWSEKGFERQFFANELSDGTLSLLCLLAVCFTPNPPAIVCIEEPEIGLHPRLLKVIGELLQELSTRTQVIVTTHSPHLVDQFNYEDVNIVERTSSGATTIMKLGSRQDLGTWLKDFSLGGLWMMGELGGQPA